MRYHLAAMGGTFDHFHKGHETLIHHAFSVAERVVIGITHESLTKDKVYQASIQTYEERYASVQHFLTQIGKEEEGCLVELQDCFGPTLTNPQVDCLVVSPLTEQGAKMINDVRMQRELSALPIEVCVLEKDMAGEYISSTRIREGGIDRKGFIYKSLLGKDIVLTQTQKTRIRQPFSKLLSSPSREDILRLLTPEMPCVAIGDIVSLFCYQNKLPVTTYVIDAKTKRESFETSREVLSSPIETLNCSNPPGVVKTELSNTLEQAFALQRHVFVTGEEDLAVIPSILLLPLESTILYGQPDKGLVVIKVTEETKSSICTFLQNK